MVNEISGLYNVEVKVRETTSLFWRPTADQKKKRRPRLRDYWTMAMTMLTYRTISMAMVISYSKSLQKNIGPYFWLKNRFLMKKWEGGGDRRFLFWPVLPSWNNENKKQEKK